MTNNQKGNQGNFANNPDRAREAGRKGGQQSGTQHEPRDRDQAQRTERDRGNM